MHGAEDHLTAAEGETVDVLSMAPDEPCTTHMLVMVRWHRRKLAVSLAQLTPIEPDELAAEAIGDWPLLGHAGLSVLTSNTVRIAAENSRPTEPSPLYR